MKCRLRLIALLAGLTVTTSCAVEPPSEADRHKVTVGIINSYSGALANFGPAWEAGYRAGLAVLTGGTGTVDGIRIEIEVRNDNGDPATGSNAAKELLGTGAKIIAGTTVTPVVLRVAQLAQENESIFIAGPTGTSQILGMGPGIFRSGQNSGQLVRTAVKAAKDAGAKSITYVGQDYAYGQTAAAELTAAARDLGMTGGQLLLPTGTQDFTAGVARLMSERPGAVFVGWAGKGLNQLLGALHAQGALDPGSGMKVMSGAPDRPTYEQFAAAVGPEALPNMVLISHYAEGTAGTDAERQMLQQIAGRRPPIDYQQADGYLAAQMTVAAIKAAGAGLDVATVNRALSGTTFQSVEGDITIRPEDHLVLSPNIETRLVRQDGQWRQRLVRTFDAEDIATPVGRKIQ
ncbi:ABC transporter substrate-binding protein [Amycolatopsis jejuensis]|uniref:ABC transporter substrate-binding protein n=1 Tax=Amycolatopsis jejuensis TaxID=330084 RepID=UPI000525265B|nr:ABC transporter substrate-binding protein [Amycolatopsis jejuensis]